MGDTSRHGLFYGKSVTCRFCDTKFRGYRLYPSARGRVEKWDDFLDIPVYEESDSGGQFSNFLRVEVKVCSGCAFSSNDDGHFLTERSTESWELLPVVVAAIQNEQPARMRIAEDAGKLQVFPRDLSDAQVSFKLAIHSSTILYNTSQRNHGVETARMGNYALKLAQLCQMQKAPERVESWHRAALEYFRRAFEASIKGPVYYRTLYQFGALSVQLGEDRSASRCFEMLRSLAGKDAGRDIQRYLERFRRVWQDREFHRAKPTINS